MTLKLRNPDTTAFIELRAQEARARGEAPKRIQRWVTYGRISPNLTRAVLVAEDDRFWKHEGIDFDELKESMEINIERDGVRARRQHDHAAAREEPVPVTVEEPDPEGSRVHDRAGLEAELSKQRILELYLNVVEWGDGIYGAEAAARTYFHKSAAELAPQECGAARRGAREPAAARSGASHPAPQTPSADGHAPHGRGDAASGRWPGRCCRRRQFRRSKPSRKCRSTPLRRCCRERLFRCRTRRPKAPGDPNSP